MDVSIIVPTFNRKSSLERTLNSLISQDYPHDKYEIIVCDDGSTDDTSVFMKNFIANSDIKIKYLIQKNSGPAVARNLGIHNSRGKIVAFIDDDCAAVNGWLSSAVNNFMDNKVGGVQGPTLQISKVPLVKKLFSYARTANVTTQDYSYASCNIFYRKDLLDLLNGFDNNFPVPCWGEDTDLGNRVILNGYKIAFDEEVVVYHDIQYIPFVAYLRSLRKYRSRALLVKRYPFMKKRYTLGFIGMKNHIYPIFLTLTILSYIVSIITNIGSIYTYALAALTVIFYLWGRVLIDNNYKLYPIRLFSFLRYMFIDFVGLYYSIIGCIRYRTLLL